MAINCTFQCVMCAIDRATRSEMLGKLCVVVVGDPCLLLYLGKETSAWFPGSRTNMNRRGNLAEESV